MQFPILSSALQFSLLVAFAEPMTGSDEITISCTRHRLPYPTRLGHCTIPSLLSIRSEICNSGAAAPFSGWDGMGTMVSWTVECFEDYPDGLVDAWVLVNNTVQDVGGCWDGVGRLIGYCVQNVTVVAGTEVYRWSGGRMWDGDAYYEVGWV